jgi:hypothetical protein
MKNTKAATLALTKHGHARKGKMSETYKTWNRIRQRCNYPKDVNYARSGGRGIKVCERWSSFVNFLFDMGEKPADKTLDRINNDGDYEPSNCRWATYAEQCSNRSDNHFVVLNGRKTTVSDAARAMGVKIARLFEWLKRNSDPPIDLALLPKVNKWPAWNIARERKS